MGGRTGTGEGGWESPIKELIMHHKINLDHRHLGPVAQAGGGGKPRGPHQAGSATPMARRPRQAADTPEAARRPWQKSVRMAKPRTRLEVLSV